jgi:hypothetical protein
MLWPSKRLAMQIAEKFPATTATSLIGKFVANSAAVVTINRKIWRSVHR